MHSPLDNISNSLFPGISLWVKRDDLLHPQISGNKFRKLKYALNTKNQHNIISMGGMWSNHLHALAFACQQKNIPCIGLVRGMPPIGKDQKFILTPTLQDCEEWGMRLIFLSKIDYRQLRNQAQSWREWVPPNYQSGLWIPEGGALEMALKGMSELVVEIARDWSEISHTSKATASGIDHIFTACGSGTSLAGMAYGLLHSQAHWALKSTHITGISVVNEQPYLTTHNTNTIAQQILSLLSTVSPKSSISNCYTLLNNYHLGGFGKTNSELRQFCEKFSQMTEVPIEPIYTGKMFYALHKLCESGYFSSDANVIAIHTGGLQGARSQSILP